MIYSKKAIEFNAKLPISIEVLEKLYSNSYLLKIGTLKIDSKSNKELIIGKKYWTELKRNNSGSILISHLIKHPEVLNDLKYFFEIDTISKVKELLDSDYKKAILSRLANSKVKSEFLFFTNILLSLKEGVVTIPIKDGSRYLFLQYKVQNESIEFYAILKNLAPISGKLDLKEQNLEIYCSYETTLLILQDEINKLETFKNISLILKRDITPLYNFKNSLLDLKG